MLKMIIRLILNGFYYNKNVKIVSNRDPENPKAWTTNSEVQPKDLRFRPKRVRRGGFRLKTDGIKVKGSS